MIASQRRILILGKPNSGKSLLFNRLTGLRQKVANFPGVTVEVMSGRAGDITYVDFPGIYSVNAITKDERVAVEKLHVALKDPDVAGIVCVLDATRLERSLFLGLQLLPIAREVGKPVLFAINMMDEVTRSGAEVNSTELSKALGVTTLPISARTGLGMEELKRQVALLGQGAGSTTAPSLSQQKLEETARDLNRRFGPKTDLILRSQNRIDDVLLSSFLGGLIFLATMAFLFQAIFSWAAPMMNLVQKVIGDAGAMTAHLAPPGILADFIEQALFGGLGTFLVFVPQIFVLTFIIGILEDSGYLVRAAIICHRPLSLFGLSGRSFVPLLSGHACAIPAVFATRTIESPRKRLLTIIALPLMACSARLPVYSLLIAALIPPVTYLGGLVGLQGLCFFALYLFGLVTALLVVGLLSKTAFRDESDAPFVLELPPYRIPHWQPLLKRSLNHCWAFITKAGTTIFVVTVAVWVMGYFPHGSGHLATSWLAALGHWIEPVFRPIGLDWKYGVAILASFLAREVFVATMGTLFGIEAAKEHIADLATRIQASGLTLASGIALLVFYALALQCVSTLAVIRRETGNSKLPILMFLGYSTLAYFAALTAFHLVQWL